MEVILTGKCLEAFLDWVLKEPNKIFKKYFGDEQDIIDEIYNLEELFLNALIIEFFDSLGCYIEPKKCTEKWSFYLFGICRLISGEEIYNTRTEATEEAIKKANEIFNLNFEK